MALDIHSKEEADNTSYFINIFNLLFYFLTIRFSINIHTL